MFDLLRFRSALIFLALFVQVSCGGAQQGGTPVGGSEREKETSSEPTEPTAQPQPVIAGVPQLVLQNGHSQVLDHVEFRADGKQILTQGTDEMAILWSQDGKRVLTHLRHDHGLIDSARYDKSGERIVTAGRDQTVRVWDSNTAQQLLKIEVTAPESLRAQFSDDGARILVQHLNWKSAAVRVSGWDARTGEPLWAAPSPLSEAIREISPGGTRALVWRGSDQDWELLDLASGVVLAVLKVPGEPGWSAHFDRTGTRLAVMGDKCAAAVFAADTGKLERQFPAHCDYEGDLAFTPDGKSLVIADQSGRETSIWDLKSGKRGVRFAEAQGLAGEAFSPGGRFFVAGTHPLRVYDVKTGKSLATFDTEYSQAQFAFSGAEDVLWIRHQRSLHRLDLKTGTASESIKHKAHHFALSADGTRLLTAGEDATLGVWDAKTGGQVHRTTRDGMLTFVGQYSPDGKRAVFATGGSLYQFEPRTDRPLGSQAKNLRAAGMIFHAEYSSTGEHLLATGWWPSVTIWNAKTGLKETDLWVGETSQSGPDGGVVEKEEDPLRARFSPDGGRVAVGYKKGRVRVWSTKGSLLHEAHPHKGDVSSLAFTHDGKHLVSMVDKELSFADSSLRATKSKRSAHKHFRMAAKRPLLAAFRAAAPLEIWNAEKAKLVRRVGPATPAAPPCFSEEGDRVAATYDDGAVRVWSTGTGTERVLSPGHRGRGIFCQFSPDGTLLVSADEGEAFLWDLTTGNRVGRADSGTVLGAQFEKDAVTLFGTNGSVRRFTRFKQREPVRYTSRTLDYHLLQGGRLFALDNGLFTGNEETFERVTYRVGSDLHEQVSADQLFESYHHARLLDEFWEDGPLKLPAQVAGGIGVPPRVTIGALPEKTSQSSVTLRVHPVARGGGVGETRVYVNGARVGDSTVLSTGSAQPQGRSEGSRGLTLTESSSAFSLTESNAVVAPAQRTTLWGPGEQEMELALAPGKNTISVESYNLLGKIRSRRVSREILVETEEASPPRLHVLLVDIGKYESDSRLAAGERPMSLKFTDEDADAIEKALRSKAARVFKSVLVRRVSDLNASRHEVRAAFEKLAADAQPQDALVVYVSGHGFVGRCEGALSYHVALTGASRKEPCEDALAVGELSRLASKIKAQRKLLLLDTCQAGGAVERETLSEIQGQAENASLRSARAAGVAILSASAASELSYEVPRWEHGLFTVALLRGLEGRAAQTGDTHISVFGLVRYVTRILPSLSARYTPRATQTPTYGLRGSDFTLARSHAGDAPLLDRKKVVVTE